MTESNIKNRAVGLLQELGLKEYEAKAFVALSRCSKATAKDISNISDVPRTRVYDAVRVLETKGLVEVQHASPQVFRAVPITEAIRTIEDEYAHRTTELKQLLEKLDRTGTDPNAEHTQEIWSLSGREAIANRTQEVIGDAHEEIILVIGDETAFSEQLATTLQQASQQDISVIIGVIGETLEEEITASVPEAEVFPSGLDWLRGDPANNEHIVLSELLLVDQSVLLVSSFDQTTAPEQRQEQAIFGTGFENGIVTIGRRLMAHGLTADHETSRSEE